MLTLTAYLCSFASDIMDEDKQLGILYTLRSEIIEAEEQKLGSSYNHLHLFKLDIFNCYTSKTNISNCTFSKRFSSIIE